MVLVLYWHRPYLPLNFPHLPFPPLHLHTLKSHSVYPKILQHNDTPHQYTHLNLNSYTNISSLLPLHHKKPPSSWCHIHISLHHCIYHDSRRNCSPHNHLFLYVILLHIYLRYSHHGIGKHDLHSHHDWSNCLDIFELLSNLNLSILLNTYRFLLGS